MGHNLDLYRAAQWKLWSLAQVRNVGALHQLKAFNIPLFIRPL